MRAPRDVVDPALARGIVKKFLRGAVTPVLGAGVNLCGRPEDFVWTPGCGHYPSGTELAHELASHFAFEGEDDRNLMAVATYVELAVGRRYLYDALRPIFDIDASPTAVHNFIAHASVVRRQTADITFAPLVVTTNYDVALEDALSMMGETFDVVAYVAEGNARGRFRHVDPSGDVVVIDDPDGYDAIDLHDRVVILKLHGTVDRGDPRRDGFVIAEEQYVQYLITDVWRAIPRVLHARLSETNLLFLGYGLRDWNLLVVLTRMGVLPPRHRSWAVQLNTSRTDVDRWRSRDIDAFDVDLVDFIGALEAALTTQ